MALGKGPDLVRLEVMQGIVGDLRLALPAAVLWHGRVTRTKGKVKPKGGQGHCCEKVQVD